MKGLNIIANINTKGWGPDNEDEQTMATCLGPLYKFPLEPNLKMDKQIRICDFTYSTYQRNIRDGGRYNRNVSGVVDDELQFQTVDGRSIIRSKNPQYYKKRVQLKQTTQAFNQKQLEEEAMLLAKQKHPELRRQKMIMQNRQHRINTRHHTFNEWSIEPASTWKLVTEIPFSQLVKIELPKVDVEVKDLFWRGKVGVYDKKNDHINLKNEVPLQNLSKALDYYWTSTHDDDCIAKLLLEPYNTSNVADQMPNVNADDLPKGSRNKPIQSQTSVEAQQLERNVLRFDKIVVATTDQILAVLMTAPRSKYSWHLTVTKIENQIIIDKANGSIVDMLTVNETAPEPPMQDAEVKINRPSALGCEAVRINQDIRQQLLVPGEVAQEYPDAPFVDEGDSPAMLAYRYRTFTIPGDLSSNTFEKLPIYIITRADVHACLSPANKDSYVYICALNEFPSKNHKTWRSQIETQKGALLANEIRNNTTKLQRFAACAALAGCDTLKLAFVTRKTPNDPERHQILSVQTYTSENLAAQMGLKMRNAWGIVRSIAQLIARKPDGHYVLLKDPMKPIIRVYSTPDDAQAATVQGGSIDAEVKVNAADAHAEVGAEEDDKVDVDKNDVGAVHAGDGSADSVYADSDTSAAINGVGINGNVKE